MEEFSRCGKVGKAAMKAYMNRKQAETTQSAATEVKSLERVMAELLGDPDDEPRRASSHRWRRGSRKLLYLGVEKLERKWTRAIPNWPAILAQLTIIFPVRLPTL